MTRRAADEDRHQPLAKFLRQLFDKSAGSFDGDYSEKVEHGLIAVYAYGRRRGAMRRSAPKPADEAV